MRYIPLSTALRPKTWDQFIFNEPVVSILKSMLIDNKLPNGLIFSGTRGVGKTSAARIFAKALNCQEPEKGNPCGKCPSCLAIEQGDYPDIIEVDGASHGNLEDIKNLLSIASMSPFMGKYKIFIIDEAHNLSRSTASFDALLKALEEPQDHVFWILCTTQKHRIPEVIRSRLVVLDLHTVPTKILSSYLDSILKSLDIKASAKVSNHIAKAARNSIRDSLTILDKVIPYCDEFGWTEANVFKVLGLVSSDAGISILANIVNNNPAQVWAAIDKLIEEGTDIDQIFSFLEDLIESLLLCILGTPFPDSEKYEKYIDLLTVPRIQYLADCLLKRTESYRLSSNKRIALELLVMELSA